jgi:uncharacterized phiE125 gp8 family phage protein
MGKHMSEILGDFDYNRDYATSIITDVTEEPITLADACLHIRQELGVDNTTVTNCLKAARAYIEKYTNQAMCLRTLEFSYSCFPEGRDDWILPIGPLQSITSVSYKDTNNSTITLSSTTYEVDTEGLNGMLYQRIGNRWPVTVVQPNSVKVRGVFGYGTQASGLIPQDMLHAVRLMLAHFYENRNPISMGLQPYPIANALDSLLAQSRIQWV